MKKLISAVCILAIAFTFLCGCAGKVCEHCGKSTSSHDLVGNAIDGILVCNSCLEKMEAGEISFTFVCDECGKEKLGKKNEVTFDGEKTYICNTCNKHFMENAARP